MCIRGIGSACVSDFWLKARRVLQTMNYWNYCCIMLCRGEMSIRWRIRMLAEFGTLSMLLSADPADISRRCGVKESTAVLLVLQSALAHRLQQEKWRDKPVLDSVSKAGAFAVDLLSHYHYERFYVLCLDNRKQLIHSCMISEGTVDESVVYPRLVVEAALRYEASSVILMHNHPGGTLMPSFSDVELTARMARILHEIGIEVASNDIIVAENQYFSFLEHDYLKEK